MTEGDLQHWAMWTGGVYLLLLTQLLENKAVIDLTEADYVEAQKVLTYQIKDALVYYSATVCDF